MTVFTLIESQLLTPDVLESPELNLVRFMVIPVIPSVVFDSDSERMCLALVRLYICDGKVPTGRVLERWVEVDKLSDSSCS